MGQSLVNLTSYVYAMSSLLGGSLGFHSRRFEPAFLFYKTLRKYDLGTYLRVPPRVSVLDLSVGSSVCNLVLGTYDEGEWIKLFD